LASQESLVVENASKGERLDLWLAHRLPTQSRARLQALIADGLVLLEGRPTRASARLRPGQAVQITIPAPVRGSPSPEDIPLRILYEDPHLLVIDKPAGLVVHPGAGTSSGTLVNALLYHVRDLSGVGGVLRPGIVHRLDKGTSGLLVVAKDDATHRELARQFATRRVQKEYLAVVLGVPAKAAGSIDNPIGRDTRARKKMSVHSPRGREAHSSYRVEEVLDGAALLRVSIQTGRTHQIRVHLASVGHPLAGDTVYGGGRALRARHAASHEALRCLKRPALHAGHLSFSHPATGETVSIRSPLPEDLATLVERLRIRKESR